MDRFSFSIHYTGKRWLLHQPEGFHRSFPLLKETVIHRSGPSAARALPWWEFLLLICIRDLARSVSVWQWQSWCVFCRPLRDFPCVMQYSRYRRTCCETSNRVHADRGYYAQSGALSLFGQTTPYQNAVIRRQTREQNPMTPLRLRFWFILIHSRILNSTHEHHFTCLPKKSKLLQPIHDPNSSHCNPQFLLHQFTPLSDPTNPLPDPKYGFRLTCGLIHPVSDSKVTPKPTRSPWPKFQSADKPREVKHRLQTA